MMRQLLAVAVLGIGLAAAPVAQRAAQALPAVKPAEGKTAIVDVGRRGGFRGGGFRRGGMGFRRGGFNRGGMGFRRGWSGRRGFYGGRGWRRGWHGGYRRGWRRGFRRGYYYGGPVIRFGYYGNRCGWLRRRAVYTGSAYWWRRYRDCRYYY